MFPHRMTNASLVMKTLCRGIVLQPKKPMKPGLTREQKLKKVDNNTPSLGLNNGSEFSDDEYETAYFEQISPLKQSRLADFKPGKPMATKGEVTSVARREKEIRMNKGMRRPLLNNTAVSQSLAMAMQTGSLPSLLGNGENNEYNDYYDLGDTTSNVVDLGFKPLDVYQEHSLSHKNNSNYLDEDEIPSDNNPIIVDNTGVKEELLRRDKITQFFNMDLDDLPPQWFPGHMQKAMNELGNRVKTIDIALEVRDARIPLSSGNPMLDALIKNKTRIVIFNKSDLIPDRKALLERIGHELGVDVASHLYKDKHVHVEILRDYGLLSQMKDMGRKDQKQEHRQDNKDGFGLYDPRTFKNRAQSEMKAKMKTSHQDEKVNALLEDVLQKYPDVVTLPSGLVNCEHIISADRKVAVIFTDGRAVKTVRSLLSLIKAMTPKRKFNAVPSSVLICGYPNVGKSTIINALKVAAKANNTSLDSYTIDNSSLQVNKTVANAKVADYAGVTRHIQAFKVSEKPPIVVLDTPGIMIPRFDKSPVGIMTSYKLAIVGSISDRVTSMKTQCKYILNLLNSSKKLKYTQYYHIPRSQPVDNVETLFYYICRYYNFTDPLLKDWATGLLTARTNNSLITGREWAARKHNARYRDMRDGIGFAKLNLQILDGNKTIANIGQRRHVLDNILQIKSEDFCDCPVCKFGYPSVEEIDYEVTSSLEERAASSFLRSFRAGALGVVDLD